MHESYARLETALTDFIDRDEPGAFLLRGEWGVGKTYACLQCLKAKNEEAQAAFSYVSLYGISTTDEIYTRIALGWHNSVTKKAPQWMRELAGHTRKTAKGIAAFLNAGELFDAVGTAAVGLMARNTLVVIDDLERRDDALSIKAAMGVITHLVESRNCRVVLISNDRMLEREEEKKEFERQKEKIFDIEMEYAPTVEENANLILKKEKELILPVLNGLEIRNIRVTRRVSHVVEYFSGHLADIPAAVRLAFLRNVAIISALHHGFRDKIDFSQLKTVFVIPSGIGVFREEKDLTETEKLLAKVAFAEGPADDEILAYLLGGWTDIPALQQKLSGTTRLYEATLARAELDEVYAKLRSNFAINADELEAAFTSVCEAKAELLPPEYLTNVGSILCKLGKTDPSPQWLERWKSDNVPRLAPTELYELLDHDLPVELRQAIQDEMDKRAGPSDMPSILRRLLTGATGRNDLKNLATVSETDFYHWMASSKDDDVISTIRHLLETLSVASEPEASIRKKIITALKRIELTDVANKIRAASLMRKFEDTAKMSPDGNQT